MDILSAETETYYQNGLQGLYRQYSITSMNLKLSSLEYKKDLRKDSRIRNVVCDVYDERIIYSLLKNCRGN